VICHPFFLFSLDKQAIQADIALSTLRSLTDEVFSFQEDVDEARRGDMLGGIVAALPCLAFAA